MKLTSLGQRVARVATVLGLLTASLAGTASATPPRFRYDQPRFYYERHHSDVGPILGGFVGGLLLGTLLSNVAQGHAAPQYVYEDPYTERCYPSYDAYLDACRFEQHPVIVRVIDTRTGACVDTRSYDGRRWVEARWDPDAYGYGYPAPRYGWDGPRYGDRDGDRRTWERERHGWRGDDRRDRGDDDDD